jgi:chromosome segregation ATPase
MQISSAMLLPLGVLCLFPCVALGREQAASPVSKVLELLSNLQAKILKEGEAATKTYDEFAEWCEDRSKDLQYAIKTGTADVEELKAVIEQQTATAAASSAKIEELAAAIAVDEKDKAAATEIREKEAADFQAEEADLMETIDVIERAIGILEREMAKSPALVQLRSAGSLADALKVLVQASAFSAADTKKLTALVQSSSKDGDASTDVGAPDPAAYKSHSGDIVATLEGLLDKAKDQLEAARASETASLHNFELLSQTLTDEIKYSTKELGEAKGNLAAAEAAKAAAEGDLAVATKALAADTKALADLHADCMEKAQDFEAETKSRGEELKALAEAKKVIAEASSGAEEIAYGEIQEGVSLLQSSRTQLLTSTDLVNFEALRFVRDLARKQKSPVLSQLAMRMASLMRYGAEQGDDPFAKVKGLIRDLVERLLAEGEAEAKEKAFCDTEMAETEAKKEDKKGEIAKLTAAIDRMSARSAQLKGQVAELQKELAALAKAQAEMDKIRTEEHAAYASNKAEMEEGIQGIKLALKILKEYYASDAQHEAATGAGAGIIGLLEVVESDFTKTLMEIETTEQTSAAEYDRQSKENEILKATMEQDVKYKTKESTELDESIGEATSDRASVQEELDAVMEYYEKLKNRCIAKPMSYEERASRREAEIAGLKQALEILNGESVALVQRSVRLRSARRT